MFFQGNTAAREQVRDTINIGDVRALLASHRVTGVTLRGEAGGFAIVLHAEGLERRLGTRSGIVRLFSSLAAASNQLEELGIQRYAVDGVGYAPKPRPRAARVTLLQRVDRTHSPKARPSGPSGAHPRRGKRFRARDEEADIDHWLAVHAA